MDIGHLAWLALAVVALVLMYFGYKRRNPLNVPEGADVWDPKVQMAVAQAQDAKFQPYVKFFPYVALGLLLWAGLEFAQKTLQAELLGASVVSFALLILYGAYAFRKPMEWRRNPWNVSITLGLLILGLGFAYGAMFADKFTGPIAPSDLYSVIGIIGFVVLFFFLTKRNKK